MKNWCIIVIMVLGGTFLAGCASHRSTGDWDGSGGVVGEPIIDVSQYGDSSQLPMDGDRGLFDPVFFSYDSSEVNPDESGKCEVVAEYLRKGDDRGVILEGHTDEHGSREYNLALGERRALAVREYLIALGVDAMVIHTRSYGEEMPENSGHTKSAWNQNRRVVFSVY